MPVFSRILLGPDLYLDLTAKKVVHRFECRLENLLGTYLAEARAAGVALRSGRPGGDSLDLDAFNGDPLSECTPEAPRLPPEPQGPASGWEPEEEPPKNSAARRRGFILPAGSGEGWAKVPAPTQETRTPAPSTSSLTPGPPQASQKKKKGKRRGKTSSRPRGGKVLKAAGGNSYVNDTQRLRKKLVSRADVYQTGSYSIERNGSRVSTGWQGRNPPPRARSEIRRLYGTKGMQGVLETFFPVYAHAERPTYLVDSDSRTFCYRTSHLAWMQDEAAAFYEAVNQLLGSDLSSTELKRKSARGERGPHFPCIMGHHRQYCCAPILTSWHRSNHVKVNAFIETPVVQRFIKTTSSIVALIFPGVASRFDTSAEWHYRNHNIEPLFGYFWNCCVNGLFLGQKRVHCLPHADSKNIVGVCVLAIFLIPGHHFNHSKRSWLVLWEAGVIIELPPWTMVAYPSALLYHFNVDVTDFKFITTEGDVRPTPENSTPIMPGDDEGRVSVVFFNQAQMYRSSELDGDSVAEAKSKGKLAVRDFGADAQAAFESTLSYIPISQ